MWQNRILTFSLIMLSLFNCSDKKPTRSTGILEISFSFSKAKNESIIPSYQFAVWLENLDGQYVKTLQVSEYLSIGGYNDLKICPAWSSKSRWDTVSVEMADAVTKATPSVGSNTLRFEVDLNDTSPSKYRYCVQAHIVENYNIQFTGEINIGDKPDSSIATISYSPEMYKGAEHVLSNVQARYLF